MKKLLAALFLAVPGLILPACAPTETVTLSPTSTVTVTVTQFVTPIQLLPPSATPGFKIYSNLVYGFSMGYPADWRVAEANRSSTTPYFTYQAPIIFSSPVPGNTDIGKCRVMVEVVDLASLSFSEWSAGVFSSASYSNMTSTAYPRPVVFAELSSRVTGSGKTYLGGIPASYLLYDARLALETYQRIEVWAQSGSKGFLIYVEVYSPKTYADFQPVVEAMIESFRVANISE